MWTLKVEYLYIAANFHWNNGRIARFVFWIRHKYKILILSWPPEHLIKSKGAPLQLQPIYLEMAALCSYTTRAALLAPTIILKWITDQYWPMRGQYSCHVTRVNQSEAGTVYPGLSIRLARSKMTRNPYWLLQMILSPCTVEHSTCSEQMSMTSLLFMIVKKEMALPG